MPGTSHHTTSLWERFYPPHVRGREWSPSCCTAPRRAAEPLSRPLGAADWQAHCILRLLLQTAGNWVAYNSWNLLLQFWRPEVWNAAGPGSLQGRLRPSPFLLLVAAGILGTWLYHFDCLLPSPLCVCVTSLCSLLRTPVMAFNRPTHLDNWG